jgi:hypothetical protein
MKEDDFVFTVGYQGDTAIVDGKLQRQHHSKNVEQLLEANLFKAAFCKALFREDEALQRQVLCVYNEKSGSHYESIDNLKRLFGVFGLPEGVSKINVI